MKTLFNKLNLFARIAKQDETISEILESLKMQNDLNAKILKENKDLRRLIDNQQDEVEAIGAEVVDMKQELDEVTENVDNLNPDAVDTDEMTNAIEHAFDNIEIAHLDGVEEFVNVDDFNELKNAVATFSQGLVNAASVIK